MRRLSATSRCVPIFAIGSVAFFDKACEHPARQAALLSRFFSRLASHASRLCPVPTSSAHLLRRVCLRPCVCFCVLVLQKLLKEMMEAQKALSESAAKAAAEVAAEAKAELA